MQQDLKAIVDTRLREIKDSSGENASVTTKVIDQLNELQELISLRKKHGSIVRALSTAALNVVEEQALKNYCTVKDFTKRNEQVDRFLTVKE